MSKDSFIALCGQIATYDKDTPFMAPVKDEIAAILKEKNCHREFFAVSNYKGATLLFFFFIVLIMSLQKF